MTVRADREARAADVARSPAVAASAGDDPPGSERLGSGYTTATRESRALMQAAAGYAGLSQLNAPASRSALRVAQKDRLASPSGQACLTPDACTFARAGA